MRLRLLIWLLIFPAINGLEVVFVTLLPHYAPLITSMRALGAVLNLTVEQAQRTYQFRFNVTIKDVYSPLYRSCADVEANQAWMAAEYYYRAASSQKCLALIGSGCNDPLTMAKLGREWNLPFFPSGYGMPLGRRQQYPTIITLASTSVRYVKILSTVFQRFHWQHVVFITDAANPITFYAEITQLLQDAKIASAMREDGYRLELLSIAGNNSQSIADALRVGRQKNRVFVLGCHVLLARDILEIATQANMTNGDYVFINFQPIDLLPYGKYGQLSNATDQLMNGYRSLLLFTVPLGSATTDEDLNREIVTLSKEMYNYTFEPGSQPMDYFVVQQARNTVDLFAQLVNESLEEIPNKPSLCGGAAIAAALSNRNFDLNGRKIFLDSEANMDLPYTLFAYNRFSSRMQAVASYNPAQRVMSWSEDFAADWPSSHSNPPPDVPICGFSGEEGPCLWERRQKLHDTIEKICGIAGGLAVVVVLVAGLLLRRGRDKGDSWFISHEQLGQHCGRRISA
ncbi:hypothetical protein RvY_14767 [Ramazzottius varieornatus]|uniref:Receptor ligand binding region domain-containing protein n=1 Tax=Ramazzottius varieornatus TaxID=947166 RepID=A0A1D1VXG2_RAMVA|nr:hypothetical protein RvY_14767 [Ramazzottius varieornatus]